jgi:hypothetical protein
MWHTHGRCEKNEQLLLVSLEKLKKKEKIRWETYVQTGTISQRTLNTSDGAWIDVVSDRN